MIAEIYEAGEEWKGGGRGERLTNPSENIGHTMELEYWTYNGTSRIKALKTSRVTLINI